MVFDFGLEKLFFFSFSFCSYPIDNDAGGGDRQGWRKRLRDRVCDLGGVSVGDGGGL